MLDLESHITGIDRLPAALKQPDDITWLSIYLARLDLIQQVIDDYLSGLLAWDNLGYDTPGLALQAVGRLLGQPRPAGATDVEYKQLLRIRRLVRQSTGTAPDIRRVVAEIGALGGGAIVRFQVPHTVIVTFGNFAIIAAKGLSLDVVTGLLIDTIGDVDRLQIWDAVGSAFTWDTEGKGWLQAVWSTPLYDSFGD